MIRFLHLILILISPSLLAADDLILYTLRTEQSPLVLPITLKSDYGYMLINQGGTKTPKPLYILADRERGVVQRFNSKKSFLTALRAIQKKGVMKHYDKCIMFLSYGLLDEHYVADEVKAICLDKGITLGKREVICTCRDHINDAISKRKEARKATLVMDVKQINGRIQAQFTNNTDSIVKIKLGDQTFVLRQGGNKTSPLLKREELMIYELDNEKKPQLRISTMILGRVGKMHFLAPKK